MKFARHALLAISIAFLASGCSIRLFSSREVHKDTEWDNRVESLTKRIAHLEALDKADETQKPDEPK